LNCYNSWSLLAVLLYCLSIFHKLCMQLKTAGFKSRCSPAHELASHPLRFRYSRKGTYSCCVPEALHMPRARCHQRCQLDDWCGHSDLVRILQEVGNNHICLQGSQLSHPKMRNAKHVCLAPLTSTPSNPF
jgi:hypothetical protein